MVVDHYLVCQLDNAPSILSMGNKKHALKGRVQGFGFWSNSKLTFFVQGPSLMARPRFLLLLMFGLWHTLGIAQSPCEEVPWKPRRTVLLVTSDFHPGAQQKVLCNDWFSVLDPETCSG